jgi:hypothetical protein
VTTHDFVEYDPLVKEMLERQVPLRLDARPDWVAVLHDARGDGVGKAVRLRSPRLLAAALGLVLIIAGASAAEGLGWLDGSSPPAIDTTHATSLVEYTLTEDISLWKAGDRIAIWRLPQPGGGVCIFTALASPKPTVPANPVSGGFCGSSEEQVPAGEPMRVSLATTRQLGGAYSWLITGTVSSGSDIARVEVQSSGGRLPLAYGHRWFLGQLPSTSTSASDLPQDGPYVIVGYDSQGKAVERLDLRKCSERNPYQVAPRAQETRATATGCI